MSGSEEVKEQTEVVMEDANSSMPSAKQEVVYRSLFLFCWILLHIFLGTLLYDLVLSSSNIYVFFLQEAAVKKKYGGLLPKKPPLISKVL